MLGVSIGSDSTIIASIFKGFQGCSRKGGI
jgi:hypothetical protein